MSETAFYQSILDHGYLRVELPVDLSECDAEDIERMFDLIFRQVKRRAYSDEQLKAAIATVAYVDFVQKRLKAGAP